MPGSIPQKATAQSWNSAHQITAISKFNDLHSGVTVNPGIVRGGTRTNVIAAEAVVEIDVRIQRSKPGPRARSEAAGVTRPRDKRCKLIVDGGINRMPMERTPGRRRSLKRAKGIAQHIGWKLDEAAVGGGSDGNFTAGIGIPTLDGMGGAGAGAHAVHEHIVISELPRRALLLAGMIEQA